MLRRTVTPALAALAALVVLTACDLPSAGTQASAVVADDYALAMFGETGTALEGTMGTQADSRPFDGRTGRPPLPEELALTDEQRAAIAELRTAFRAEHEEELDALREIFQAARTARQSGATREEVRAILEQGREIAVALRPALKELHDALRAVLTDAQRAWLDEHRPRRFPRPIAGP
ncbi:MAG: Spy/CpxP family protein refolding chaperone [Gemmatimonadaceae bacterium]